MSLPSPRDTGYILVGFDRDRQPLYRSRDHLKEECRRLAEFLQRECFREYTEAQEGIQRILDSADGADDAYALLRVLAVEFESRPGFDSEWGSYREIK